MKRVRACVNGFECGLKVSLFVTYSHYLLPSSYLILSLFNPVQRVIWSPETKLCVKVQHFESSLRIN